MIKSLILSILLINSILCKASIHNKSASDCKACGEYGAGCLYDKCTAVSGIPTCLNCMAVISPSCYSCASYLCSSSKIDEIDQKSPCSIGMPSYGCELFCRCRYKKTNGNCRRGTCYCN